MLSRPALAVAAASRLSACAAAAAVRLPAPARHLAMLGGPARPPRLPAALPGRSLPAGRVLDPVRGPGVARRALASSALPPHRVVDLPAMSPTMSVGNVGPWKKKVGDKISAGDVLVEIETDKATMDFESQEEGFLAKILIEGGAKDVPVGKPLAIFVENAGDVQAFADYVVDSSASPAASTPGSAPAPAAAGPAPSNPDAFPPHQVIGLPAMSPTMESGNVGAWKKKEGDKVNPGDVLVEVETDKAQMDFECQDEGYLAKILVPENTKDVKVGQPLAIFVADAADVPKFASYVPAGTPSPAPQAPAPKPAAAAASSPPPPAPKAGSPKAAAPSTPRSPTDRVKASPLARKLAREKNVPLEDIAGRGPRGRIVKADVDSYTPRAQPAGAVPARPRAPRVRPAEPFTDVPLTNMRKVIAKRLSESKNSIPHFYLTMEIEMDRVLKLREILNAQAADKYKLSVNDFVVKAAALALREMPEVNSGWNGESIRQYNSVDISIAVAIDSGLITPIVFDADSKGIATISNDIKDLAARAKKGKLLPQEFQGGSFSISNLGMFGISHFTAIINPPQACILAVGGTTQKVVPDEESKSGFRAVSVMNVTMSCDHRVVDGAVGARWLQKLKANLEHPLGLVL
ncbi:2-oxoacid dehydrogenases acyltransferase-domain-containing protein [Hyaloraphidium curvatum]|nr:2-oxoacid dehydrogenases acyltransferase-domain-containing protein [Hyaloraphidium curvatum]